MSDIIRDITEITRCGAQYKSDNLAPFGLKGCHPSYLGEICACPGISQDKLAQRICINKSNVARQAAILEEDGFILRKPSQTDKRVMELYPTEKTLQLMPQIMQIIDCWTSSLTEDLSAEEVAVLEKALLRMRTKAAAWLDKND
ncbi:MAG: MarR family transcriptional regulator [Ruminococcaceae bacterium]|nr:MarR family transcriptional regulator [Oscillospiraceae bacterium]